jgi:hypothetical protein
MTFVGDVRVRLPMKGIIALIAVSLALLAVCVAAATTA